MDTATLVRMANQIARAFAAEGEDQAILQTAQHIREFWDPRMKAAIRGADASALDPVAAAALQRL